MGAREKTVEMFFTGFFRPEVPCRLIYTEFGLFFCGSICCSTSQVRESKDAPYLGSLSRVRPLGVEVEFFGPDLFLVPLSTSKILCIRNLRAHF